VWREEKKPAIICLKNLQGIILVQETNKKWQRQTKIPFNDGDKEIDDDTFLTSDEEQQRQIMLKIKEIETSTVESSNRSLGLLYESENVGAATGAELQRQKE